MKKILVFGTGGAAEKLIANSGEIYDIVAFADNDPKKQGTLFHDRPVVPPARIREFDIEHVIIASMWYHDIKGQLVEQYGFPEDFIRPIPKIFASAGKRYRPFEDDATRAFAGRVLQHITAFLENRGIPCYVDHGTLLGLVRDNGLMPWDDDLDLSVAATDRPRLTACIRDLVAAMPDRDRIGWRTELIYNSLDDAIALFLTVEDPTEKINVFNAGLSFFTFENDLAVEAINWAPRDHYAGGEWIETSLGRFRAPNRFRDYLALHYGEWQTPVKDMSFNQINNFKRREATAHWVPWNPDEMPSPEPLLDAQRAAPIHGGRLFVLASRENPAPDQPRIPADLAQLEDSLRALSPHLHVDVAVVCGADPNVPGQLRPILDMLQRSAIADKIHVEMGLDAQPCPEVLAAMDSVGSQRAFHRKSIQKREDPPIFADSACTAAMRGAIRQFRCRYKKRWLLWNRTFAHCPQALTQHFAGAADAVRDDIADLDPAAPDLKTRLLAVVRHRPCAVHRTCEGIDRVWEPFAVYTFTRSPYAVANSTGDQDD